MNKYIVAFIIFTLPLIFSSYFSNFFTTPKQIFLIIATLLLLLLAAAQIFAHKTLLQNTSTIRFGLLAFASAILLNIIVYPLGRVEALTGTGGLYLSLCLWGYLLTLDHSRQLKELTIYTFLGSSAVLALHTLAQLTFLYKLESLPIYMQSRVFSLTGSHLISLIILLIASVLSFYLTLNHHKQKSIFAILATLFTISLIALGALMLPGQELALNILPLSAAWNLALDAMKNAKSFFLGVGLTNFSNFYTSSKPLFLNTTIFWNILPTTSSSELLQILTTSGMIGLLAFLSIPFIAIAHHEPADWLSTSLKIILALSLVSLIFTPGSILVLFLLFTSASLLSSTQSKSLTLSTPVTYIIVLIVSSLVGVIGFYTINVARAEASVRQAQLAVSVNDGKTLYESSQKAMQIMPSMTSYRLYYSQINLSLATALSQKPSLSDEERANVTTLISQAIREGKSAISLSPNSSSTWQNLGFIYQSLINVAENSDQYAIEAYSQAVTLDPANPALRVEFGGMMYQLSQVAKDQTVKANLLSRAQSEFQTAIQLKPDYPNSYYNLAKLLESIKDYANAATVLQKAISLLGPDNQGLERANAELEAIKAQIPAATPAPSTTPKTTTTNSDPVTTISEPSPLPSPLDGGPIELPAEPTL